MPPNLRHAVVKSVARGLQHTAFVPLRSQGKPKKKKKSKRIGFVLGFNQDQVRLLCAWTNPELNRGPHPDSEVLLQRLLVCCGFRHWGYRGDFQDASYH